MKLVIKFVVVAWFLLGSSHSVISQKTQKEERVLELLKLSGSGDIGKQYFVSIMDQFQQLFDDVPQVFWEEAKNLMDPNELMELIIPIYERNFTEEEIEGLIAFYKSPLGQKLVKEQPIILQESMRAGEIFGEEFSTRVVDKLKSEGY